MVNMLKVAFRHVHRAIFLGGKAASMPCCSTDRSLEEDYLVPLLIESFTRNIDGSLRQVSRDIRKAERRNGRYRLICGEENRKNTMPQRSMGCDYAAYEEQIRTLVHQNKTTGKIYRKTRQSQLFPEIQEKSPSLLPVPPKNAIFY